MGRRRSEIQPSDFESTEGFELPEDIKKESAEAMGKAQAIHQQSCSEAEIEQLLDLNA